MHLVLVIGPGFVVCFDQGSSLFDPDLVCFVVGPGLFLTVFDPGSVSVSSCPIRAYFLLCLIRGRLCFLVRASVLFLLIRTLPFLSRLLFLICFEAGLVSYVALIRALFLILLWSGLCLFFLCFGPGPVSIFF